MYSFWKRREAAGLEWVNKNLPIEICLHKLRQLYVCRLINFPLSHQPNINAV
jgi:hypothetical protein